ncbi:MAG TPA: hypothetical protein HA349_04075 [Methanotrichaceae archaeon]|nr:hypothetical protein [Methanotrichaceae archaeon]
MAKEEEESKCPLCGETFSSKEELEKHKKEHKK